MTRPILAALLALALAGCVIPTDPVRLAAQGPVTAAQLVEAGRPLQAGDQVALAVLETALDRPRLLRCLTQGMEARLPPGVSIVLLDEARAAALGAALAPRQPGGAAPDDLGPALRMDTPHWAVAVRDMSEQSSRNNVEPFGAGGGGGGISGVAAGQETDYTLRLQAELVDLRAARRFGTVSAYFGAHGGGAIVAGIAGAAGGNVGIVVPFGLPVIRVPAGTNALAICNAFGRAVGDALVRATTPPPAAAP